MNGPPVRGQEQHVQYRSVLKFSGHSFSKSAIWCEKQNGRRLGGYLQK